MGTAVFVVVFALIGLAGLALFGDAQPGRRRRAGQNAVYRAYQFTWWLMAVCEGMVTGLDCGLRAYYDARARNPIKPINERKFKPVEAARRPVPTVLSVDSEWITERKKA